MRFIYTLLSSRPTVFCLLLLVTFLLTNRIFSQTVITDTTDYPPGDTVFITGEGWQAGESVKLQVLHAGSAGDNDSSAAHQPWFVDADSLGNIFSFWVVPADEDELGATLLLTADGQASLAHAQATFTDAVTQPPSQLLPYSTNFSALPFSGPGSTNYPAGWQGWKVGSSSSGSFRTGDATADEALIANSSASTSSGGILNYNQKIGLLATSATDPALVLAVSTTAHSNITMQFDVMTVRNPYDGSSNTRINQVDVQYRIGTSGSFTSLSSSSSGIYQNNTTTQTGSGVTTPQNSVFKSFTLPAACNNQSTVQIRWVQRDVSGGGSRPGFAIDNINIISCTAPTIAGQGSNTTIECTAAPVFSAPTAADGCGVVTVNIISDQTATGTCPVRYSRTVSWEAVDDNGNHSNTVSQTITVVDLQPPSIGPAGDDATIECTIEPIFTAPTAMDACGSSSVVQSGEDITAGSSCFKTTTRIWLAVDACGNSSNTISQTITQVDTQPPTIGAAGVDATIVGTATPVFTTPTASDACGAATVLLISDITVAGSCSNNYARTKTWNAIDGCGNTSATRSQTVTIVDATPVVIANNASQSVIYGSAIAPVDIIATDADSPAGGLVVNSYYRKNGGNLVAGLPSTLSLTLTKEITNSTTWKLSGCMTENVGSYEIKLVVLDDCGSLDSTKVTITVNPGSVLPAADAFYTGSCFYWTTGPASSTATLTLTATLKNVANNCGDIRTAKVSFFIRSGTCPNFSLVPITGAQNLQVGLVNPADFNTGSASATVQYNIGSATASVLDIAVVVGGNYATNDCGTDKAIMIAMPLAGGQICGGGHFDNVGSSGYLAGATGQNGANPDSLTNFSFYVQYNKSLRNPQGNVDLKILSFNNSNGSADGNLHVYRVKSNAISSLVVNAPNAQFSGKCNVAEIVNGIEQGIQGNCLMQMSIFDSVHTGQSPKYDSVAVTIYRNNGGIWFSSKWNGVTPARKKIHDGHTSVTGATSGSLAKPLPEETGSGQKFPEHFLVKVIPNPAQHYFRIIIESSSVEMVQIKLFDIAGRQVTIVKRDCGESICFGDQLTRGVYVAEVTQGKNRKIVRLVKQ